MRSTSTATNDGSGPRPCAAECATAALDCDAAQPGLRASISGAVFSGLAACLLLAGCANVPNQWREDGPSVGAEWNSPTAIDVRDHYKPAPPKTRKQPEMVLAAEPYGVAHWPLYFENPFVDKGHGRQGSNKYHIGWEDCIAVPYSYARFTVNWLFLPVSAVVTPPWTLMASDGEISEQCLGPDQDATRVN